MQQRRFASPWQQALRRAALDPEHYRRQYPEMHYDSDFLLIRDGYPKARLHYLGGATCRLTVYLTLWFSGLSRPRARVGGVAAPGALGGAGTSAPSSAGVARARRRGAAMWIP